VVITDYSLYLSTVSSLGTLLWSLVNLGFLLRPRVIGEGMPPKIDHGVGLLLQSVLCYKSSGNLFDDPAFMQVGECDEREDSVSDQVQMDRCRGGG
jgi:hypothetical protein